MTSSQEDQEEIQKEKNKQTDIWFNFRKWIRPITFQHDLGYSYGGNCNYYLCNLRISVSIYLFIFLRTYFVRFYPHFIPKHFYPYYFSLFHPRENDRIYLFSFHFFCLSPPAFPNHVVHCFLSGKELLILTLSSSDGNNSRASSVHFI